MTEADDVVKERLARERAGRGEAEAMQLDAVIDSGVDYLTEAIPRLLARLAELEYPGAEVVGVSVRGPRRLFRGQQRQSVEMAGWLLDKDEYSEGRSELYLLSDGRLKARGWSSQSGWDSEGIDVSRIPIEYSPKNGARVVERARSGVDRLLARHGAG
jgi:hypothetical protein